VDIGFTNIQDVSEEAFAEFQYAEQWSPFYRERYELAKREEDGLIVVSSVLVSRGDKIRVRESSIARLKDIAEMLREERSTAYELKQEADNSILIVASQSRAVAVGYRPLRPSRMPSLASRHHRRRRRVRLPRNTFWHGLLTMNRIGYSKSKKLTSPTVSSSGKATQMRYSKCGVRPWTFHTKR
jgi:hypothetical protein